MVSCQEPSPLKGSKHSKQCHPHDAALVNALSFVSMGVEARCHPCHSAAHFQHMKRQPFLCNGHPHCGLCHCQCHCQLRRRCCCRLCCHCRCCRLCPLPSPLLSAIAVAVAVTITTAISVALSSAIAVLVALAVGHCRLRHCRPLQLPSSLAITVAIAIHHFQELLPWHSENCI